ncbi:TIGR03364 family FAD-dependent oxidoreductase [Corynebacterium pseudopelargi]|uniref:D-amino acid dehydrogenase small subunit n=1 Tax=Corynebacterium pseudopelargi TaxID=2080757 RepID=A0A3G6J0U1_9CORY|nr:TIGR03364 family FAD-dependent oxidoreductase [Corynebacterium pseudopelargi]AZA09980.1 D-amino acid dehydrogenase small subunit [Corynebacterium pseudopelargi]
MHQNPQHPAKPFDIIVVGAGIIGLATAYRAYKQGHNVMVIERNSRPTGASIQNFGHACFTGQADELQAMVAKSREGWISAAQDAGFWAAQPGTLIPATSDVEMSVLEQFANHRGQEQVTLLSPSEVEQRLGHQRLKPVGGALLPLDMRVNPREAAATLAQWLEAQGVTFQWNTTLRSTADGVVDTSRGQWEAQRVVLCPGVNLSYLLPDLAQAEGVRSCTLSMALVERPDHIASDFCMLTGTSLARYDGFSAMASVPELRQELQQREPELVECIANLMVTAIPEGLLVGDSHDYHDSPTPFISEETASLLQSKAAAYLGVDKLRVKQRWQGVYADSPSTNLVVHRPDAKTVVAVVASGIGMTLSFGLAEHILDQF